MSARPYHHRWTDESGTSLVELLVAFTILTIAFTALAGALIANVQHLNNAERETAATATALGLIERMQSLPWDAAGVYEADMTDPSPDGLRWASRVSGGTYDGMDLVTVPGPFGASDRDERIPRPWNTTSAPGAEYAVDVYPVYVDLDGDGTEDSKRFVTVTTWTDRFGEDRELVTAAERAPSQTEATSTSTGVRVLSMRPAPSVVELDDAGFSTVEINVVVRFSSGVALPVLSFESVDASGLALTARTVNMSTSGPVDGGGYSVATVTVPPGVYALPDGVMVLTVTAKEYGSTSKVVGSANVVLNGGPYVGPLTGDPIADPTDEPGDGPLVDPSDDPTDVVPGDVGPVAITGIPNVSAICVNGGNWRLTKPIEFRVQIQSLANRITDETYGTATVVYPYWSKKNKKSPGSPDLVGTIALTYGGTGTQWVGSIPAGASALFASGEDIAFTVSANRLDGSAAVTITSNTRINSC